MENILVTGVAGFISFHLLQILADCGNRVTSIDNIKDYYDISLKNARLALLYSLSGIGINYRVKEHSKEHLRLPRREAALKPVLSNATWAR
jgi:nucleoside-diphosphate-sugar epimerase